jgi:hypothetical protein
MIFEKKGEQEWIISPQKKCLSLALYWGYLWRQRLLSLWTTLSTSSNFLYYKGKE